MRRMAAAALFACFASLASAQVVSTIREGVHRFDLDEQAKRSAPATAVFAEPEVREKAVEGGAGPSVRPSLAMVDGRFVVTVSGEPGTSYYGGSLGHHRFARNGLEITSDGRPAPWAIGVRPDGSAFGVLVDSAEAVAVSFEDGIRIETAGPARPVIVIDVAHPATAAMTLQQLIGQAALPPKWAFGVHHVLPAGIGAEQIAAVARTLRARDVPGDVLWLQPGERADESAMAAAKALGFRVLTLGEGGDPSQAVLLPEFGGADAIGPDRTLLVIEPVRDSDQAISSAFSLGISGFPFFGALKGDSADDASSDRQWLEVGPFLPLAIGPLPASGRWSEAEQRSLLSRMALLPHIYTAAYQSHQTGVPMLRPVMFEHVDAPDLRGTTRAFMLGNGLALSEHDRPFSPDGEGWRRFDLRDAFGGTKPVSEEPHLWLRAGHMVATGPLMEHVDEAPPEPLTLYVNLDERGAARGYVYEDDGRGAGFTDEQSVLTIYGAVRNRQGQLQLLRLGQQGERERYARTLRVIWLTDDGWFVGEGLDGSPITIDPASSLRVGP